MQTVYILQAQGFGDNEYEFYNIGAFSTRAKLDAALTELQDEYDMEVVTNVEELQVDA